MNTKTNIKLSAFWFSIVLLSGCASFVALKPGAEKVIFTTSTVPQSCRLLGQISSADKNGVSTSYTSHANLQTMEINTLKNKAVSLGANVVMLTHHQTTYEESGLSLSQRVPKNIRDIPRYPRVDIHQLVGSAYVCSPSVLSSVSNVDSDAISDKRGNTLFTIRTH
jgi:hypothetical protein